MQEHDIAQLAAVIAAALQGDEARKAALPSVQVQASSEAGLQQETAMAQEHIPGEDQQAKALSNQSMRHLGIGSSVHATPPDPKKAAPVELQDITTEEFKAACRVANPNKAEVLSELRRATGARIATGKCGTRPPTSAYLRFLADHARSKGTVFKEVSQEWLDKNKLWSVRSMVEDKNTYLTRPDLGRLLSEDSLAALKQRYPVPSQVQIVLSDGLSTDALLNNYEEILPPLCKGLKNAGFKVGDPFFLHYGRVKAEDSIGEAIGCDVVLLLIGERPGLGQSESMSCYAVYKPTSQTLESQRTVISNIHKGGIPPVEAAAVIVELATNILRYQASGIELNTRMGAGDV